MPVTRWLQQMRPRLGAPDAGFTVLEALVSFVIFAAVATSASYAIVRALNASHLTQQRVEASDVAQAVIADAIRNATTIAQIPAPGKVLPPTGVGGTDASGNPIAEREGFKVVETVVYDNGGSCNTGTMFTVNVEVYQEQSSQFLARSDARVACPRV